ncbi:MAG: class I SAM-dependent methyltransferase [Ginsengibacter sp.]
MSFERIVPGTKEWDMYYANHQSRYQFAVDYLADYNCKKVLDAATGVGFGANILAQRNIENIIAIDRNDNAIDLARKHFQHQKIHFIKDDCETFEQSKKYFPFDAVVSFETLEHLPNPMQFLDNCKRALQPDGQLIISTPNKLVSSPGGKVSWAFHETEYTAGELITLLKNEGFNDIKLFGQQFTLVGILRRQMRSELNRINFNPFIRLGNWVQHYVRRISFNTVLPEQPEDFEILEYKYSDDIDSKKMNGPFVLIAVCKK